MSCGIFANHSMMGFGLFYESNPPMVEIRCWTFVRQNIRFRNIPIARHSGTRWDCLTGTRQHFLDVTYDIGTRKATTPSPQSHCGCRFRGLGCWIHAPYDMDASQQIQCRAASAPAGPTLSPCDTPRQLPFRPLIDGWARQLVTTNLPVAQDLLAKRTAQRLMAHRWRTEPWTATAILTQRRGAEEERPRPSRLGENAPHG